VSEGPGKKVCAPGPDGGRKEGMRRALAILVVLTSAWSCGRPEWAIPRNGGSACMCSMACSCNASANEESQQERERCRDACSCDPCPSDRKKSE
jgi:hypothetical protein